jgi:hypothetical protein
MSYQKLLKDENYIFKVSGMHINNAHTVRNNKPKESEMTKEYSNMKKNIEKLFPKLSIGVIFSGAMKDFCKECNMDEDIIAVFISDITDIDSKLMTFIRKDRKHVDFSEDSEIWKKLYRVDLTQ